jgi:hypothetical protein
MVAVPGALPVPASSPPTPSSVGPPALPRFAQALCLAVRVRSFVCPPGLPLARSLRHTCSSTMRQ